MQESSVTIWHTANWLTFGAVVRFGRGRARQQTDASEKICGQSLLNLADEILYRQLALRYQISSEPESADPSGYWAPVFILFQQTADLLHELHQQILELSPVRFAPVIPCLDLQLKAFRIGDREPEILICGFFDNSDQLIRDMSDIRSGLKTIIYPEPGS
jgi:hypothetical protein